VSDALRLTLSETHTDAKLDYAYPNGRLTAFNERNEDILSAKADYRASDSLQFFVKAYYHWWYAHFTEYDNDVGPDGALLGSVTIVDNHDFWGFTDYGVNAMAKYTPVPAIDAYLGYDSQSYTGNDVVLVIDQHSEQVHAIFGEVATTSAFLPNAQFAVGFRHNMPSAGPSATVWNVTGRYDVLPGTLYVKGMVGTAFRLPTAEELFANDPEDERGDPNLKPERSTNVNLSIGGSLGIEGVHWEAIGFYRDIKDLIQAATFDPETNQDVFGNVPGTVRTRGFELVLDAAFDDVLSGQVSYTYSRSENSATGLQINRVPEQLAKAVVDYHPMAQPFGLTASLSYVGDTFDTPGGVRTKYGDYVVVDLGGRVFLDPDRHHRIDLGIHNLFDNEYATSVQRGFPDNGDPAYIVGNLGVPRTFYASYTYRFF
jgi:vitamin B12 transporter